MPPQLVALTEGSNILLDKPILLLGRHEECDVQLGSRKVSRRHCCLAQVSDYVVVRDLGSTNGIRINGVRVVEGSLHPGDELTIGNQRFQLQWGSRADRVPPAAAPGPESFAPDTLMPRVRDEDIESSENPIPLPEPNPPVQANGYPLPPPILPDSLKLAPLSGQKQVPGQ